MKEAENGSIVIEDKLYYKEEIVEQLQNSQHYSEISSIQIRKQLI